MSAAIPLADACRRARCPLGVAQRAIRCGFLFSLDGRQVSPSIMPELEALGRSIRAKRLRRTLARHEGVYLGSEGSWQAAGL
jgi:hypothetical protein